MARSTGRNNNQKNRESGSQGGRGKGRESSYSSQGNTAKKGLCSALGKYMFDYGHKTAADEMRTTWEKIIQYISTIYGQNISNKLYHKKIILPEPVYTTIVLTRHVQRETVIKQSQTNLAAVKTKQKAIN